MIVPILALPNSVCFPKTLVPFLIFVERYLAMRRKVFAEDGRVAVALLRGGRGTEDEEDPPMPEIADLGKIETYKELEDGKYDIILAGVRRVRR